MDDAELIQKSLEGDEEAFNILVKLYQKKIFYLCLKMVHDEEIAQDLTQETFLHAYQHLNTFRMEAQFSTWIWRIAYNLTLNYVKKQKRWQEKEYKEEILHKIPFEHESSEEMEEMKERIQHELEKLPLKQRQIFELYIFEKLPQKQIAAQLNIPLGTVRSRLHYAKKKIHQHLINHSTE